MDNQQRVNRRRRRNLPAELNVEIVDCLPLENAVHFLANVPNRLIIHHCAPRIRRMLKMIDQIAADYARTLLAPNSHGRIRVMNGHQYTPEMDIFLRHGAAHCRSIDIYHDFDIYSGISTSFVGYPANFFDHLIKYCYETKIPTKTVRRVGIGLSLDNLNLVPWPAVLVQPQAREMDVEEYRVNNDRKWIKYILRNKHNPNIAFKLRIEFEGEAKCYEQMTDFEMRRVENVQ